MDAIIEAAVASFFSLFLIACFVSAIMKDGKYKP